MNNDPVFSQRITRAINWLSSPAVVFFTMPPLMALLVAGTIAQRYIGLYQAQKMFFSSFVLWAGPVPLPGGYLLIAVIFISLLVKFLFKSPWRLQKAGINLTHLGILIMLFGGLLTAFNAKEGYMVIAEGESTGTVLDYHRRSLVILKNDTLYAEAPQNRLAAGNTLSFSGLPFILYIEDSCHNCAINARSEAEKDGALPLRSMAQFMALSPKKPEKDDEANLAGATIALSGAGPDFDGRYVVFEAMPKPITLTLDDARYEIIFGKAQRELPFTLTLDDFDKQVYPGTDKARSYRSDITVHDGALSWPVRIEMNKPLRYKGYTLFQSSFIEGPQGTASVLAVVKNGAWLFPYIGTAIIACGLLLHMFLAGGQRRRG